MKGTPRGGRRRVLLFISIPAFAVAAACAGPAADVPAADEPAAADAPQESVTNYTADDLLLAATKVALPPTGYTAADLPDPESQGAQYVVRFCSRCHAVPSPASHSATDWPVVLRRMWMRMGRIDPAYGIPVAELGDQLVILDYLTANALKVSAENLPDYPGREAFETTCGECHELADPKQHSAGDWFTVVRRMNEHMREILGQEMTAEEIREIVQYLERAAT